MMPTRAFLLILCVPTLLSVGTLIDRRLIAPVVVMDALLALLLAVDFILTRRVTVSASTEHRTILSLGQPNLATVTFRHSGRQSLLLTVSRDLPETFSYRDLPMNLMVGANAGALATYHLVPSRRGQYELGDYFVRYTSRLGMLRFQTRVFERSEARVYPDLASIRTYELLARQHREYALVRASAPSGGESEFSRLRDYTKGDDVRAIDWKATARRGQLTSREFQLESDQNIIFALDAGRLMTAEVNGVTQFDHALNSALLTAHVAARGGDRVGLICFNERVVSFTPPRGGPSAAARLVQQSYALAPSLTQSNFTDALASISEKIQKRSLMILFTQLVDDAATLELARSLQKLKKRHLTLVVLLEDTDLSALLHGNGETHGSGPHRSGPHGSGERARTSGQDDLFLRGAAAELLTWKAKAAAALKKSGALVLECSPDGLSSQVINRYLSIKTRRAL